MSQSRHEPFSQQSLQYMAPTADFGIIIMPIHVCETDMCKWDEADTRFMHWPRDEHFSCCLNASAQLNGTLLIDCQIVSSLNIHHVPYEHTVCTTVQIVRQSSIIFERIDDVVSRQVSNTKYLQHPCIRSICVTIISCARKG